MRRAAVVGTVAGVLAGATVVLRRLGYPIGTKTLVRCRAGHLFTTIWIPGASAKALRLGWWRFQRCPVGRHWTLVSPVRVSGLDDEERAFAAAHRDAPIP